MNSQEVDTILVMTSQSRNSRSRPRNRSLTIVFEVEPTYDDLPERMFAGIFHNEDTVVHARLEIKGLGHY